MKRRAARDRSSVLVAEEGETWEIARSRGNPSIVLILKTIGKYRYWVRLDGDAYNEQDLIGLIRKID